MNDPSPTSEAPKEAPYRDFVRGHRDLLRNAENAVRAGTYWLPGRFASSDLPSETLLAGVNLLTIWNDAIAEPDPPAGLRAEHVGEEQARRGAVRRIWRAIGIVQCLEAVVEVGAERTMGERARWRLVCALEAVKAALKLRLVSLRPHALLQPHDSPVDVDGVHEAQDQSPLLHLLSAARSTMGGALQHYA
eukprot:CAMPEP_0206059066 /NCGR_PEP_ID=MMETSP1466-20131121/48097_1 /ASSEMBLY_ACC=CAM_ASM_001126 /TAXON_ID=44452 /ORGANISM="Pavlova gyrans, Strain CCMP608" /LENGTH=190 /DNA_ID=CAMNT_0053434377 /DNA_START=55 /DNA_END=623 /DNA_ORIENTATION=+